MHSHALVTSINATLMKFISEYNTWLCCNFQNIIITDGVYHRNTLRTHFVYDLYGPSGSPFFKIKEREKGREIVIYGAGSEKRQKHFFGWEFYSFLLFCFISE